VFFGFCIKAARFVDQLVIEPGTFSGGGDSGSLIVTDDGNKNPVALLFAGSSTQTIANRIDLVLNRFAVHVDGGTSAPPAPVTDLAITSVTAPSSVTRGSTVNVVVTIKNVGNQGVSTPFNVSLQDVTDNVTVGSQSVGGLVAGASTTRTFSWNTAASSTGGHTLTASHDLTDNNGANNQASTAVTVNDASSVIHIGDLDGSASSNGSNWSVTVEITVHDANHNPLNGATVVGHWSQLGVNSNTCTTGDLGGNGTCIVLFPSLKRGVTFVNFTVVSVTQPGRTYDRTLNHDVDGSSNGTTVRVYRP
jgi:CARDB